MILTAFTLLHVALSLVGILSGFVVLAGFLTAKRSNGWTALFLTTTVLTSVTGFLFTFHKFLPSHAVGIVSLLVLAVAIPALYVFHLAGSWRLTYVIGAVIALYLNVFVLIAQQFMKVPALYLNVFVLIAQLFMKVPALKAPAPTQSEPPFLGTQVVVMLVLLSLGFSQRNASPRKRPTQSERCCWLWRIVCILLSSRSINSFIPRELEQETSVLGKGFPVGANHEYEYETQTLDRRRALLGRHRRDHRSDAAKACIGRAAGRRSGR